MKAPTQSAPVQRNKYDRKVAERAGASNGLTQSQQCGCPNFCLGACAFGHCQGVCISREREPRDAESLAASWTFEQGRACSRIAPLSWNARPHCQRHNRKVRGKSKVSPT